MLKMQKLRPSRASEQPASEVAPQFLRRGARAAGGRTVTLVFPPLPPPEPLFLTRFPTSCEAVGRHLC